MRDGIQSARHRYRDCLERHLVNFALIVGSVLTLVFLIELSMRGYSYLRPARVMSAGHHKLLVEHDPLLGWRKIPNTSVRLVTEEYSITESVNSRGIRGPEYPYKKRPGEYRILILGDSFAEGYTVEFGQLFSEVLKARLNESRLVNYEVINSGTGGYSTDQELLLFREEGKKYAPDLTVLMFYANDVWYNNEREYSRGYKPHFRLDDGKLVLTNVPVPRRVTVSESTKPPIEDQPVLHRTKAWFYRNSLLYRFVRERLERIDRVYSFLVSIGLAQGEDQTFPQEWNVWQRGYTGEVKEAWELTTLIVKKLKDEVKSTGSELLVFYIPFRAAIYDEEWEAIKSEHGLSDVGWNPHQVGIGLQRFCKRNGIAFFDPTNMFRSEAARLARHGRRLYFENDGHWNVDEHWLAGVILADYVKTRRWSESVMHKLNG